MSFNPTNPTETFDFSQPLHRQDLWHEDWYHNFDILEDELIATDTRANRDQYQPSEERIYLAYDTGEFFYGTGSGWVPLLQPLAGDNLKYENGQFHAPVVDENGEIVEVPDHDHSDVGEGDGPLGIANPVPGTSRFEAVDTTSTRTDSLQDGSNPAETISATGSTLSFTGTEDRDVHDATDVALSNGTTGEITEDVTVDYYAGVDATGTLVATETRSITLASGANTTVTFLTDEFSLGSGDYFVEVTTTDLTVDGIDENTLGAAYTTEQDAEGDLVTTDQQGRERKRYDSVSDTVSFPSVSAESGAVMDAPVNDTDIARLLEIETLDTEKAPLDGAGTEELTNYASLGADNVQTDRLQNGSDPAETISSTGSSLSFTGSEDRDVHDATDVELSNGTASSVTEDVVLDYYEGSDSSGTLIASETRSITLASGANTTVTFLTDDFGLGLGDYYLEVSTTDLTTNSIDEHTLGAEYVTEQTDEGDLVTTDQQGRERTRYDATSGTVSHPAVDTGELNNVLWAESPDDMQAKLDALPAGRGGTVRLVPGVYGDADWTSPIVIPDEPNSHYVIDMRGSILEPTDFAPVDGYIQKLESDSVKQKSIEFYGPSKADLSSVTDPPAFLNLSTLENSFVYVPSGVGSTEAVVKCHTDTASLHMNQMYVDWFGCKVGYHISGGTQTNDRSFYYGQFDRVEDAAVKLENGKRNEFWIQLENSKSGYTATTYDFDGNCQANKIHLVHGKTGLEALDVEGDNNIIYTSFHAGNDEVFSESKAAIKPRHFIGPGWFTTFSASFSDGYLALMESDGAGSVSVNNYGAAVINAGTTSGNSQRLQTQSRIGSESSPKQIYCDWRPNSTTNGIYRFGYRHDANNFAMFEADTANSNLHVRVVDGGTEQANVDTGVPIEQVQKECIATITADTQQWFIEGSHVAETNVDVTGFPIPSKASVEAEVTGSPADDVRIFASEFEHLSR